MAEFSVAVEKVEKSSLFGHLCRQRNDAAKVFPHRGEKGFGFSKRVQGYKLNAASLKALQAIAASTAVIASGIISVTNNSATTASRIKHLIAGVIRIVPPLFLLE